MSIYFEGTGEFKQTNAWLEKIRQDSIYRALRKYGDQGVQALSEATPKDTGETSGSWYYEIKKDRNSYSIIWGNSNVVDGVPIVVLLQHGHGTGGGAYVPGRDFINPALRPIFDQIANEVWEEVRKA